MPVKPVALLLATALAVSAVSVTAEAQPPAPARDPAAAEVLFRAALTALDKGDWAVACAKFDASMDLDPSVATLIHVARCHEHEGKLTAAWADLNRALVLNGETVGAQRKADLERFARGLIAGIEPRLPKLLIVVRDKPRGLRITRDGAEISPAAIGEALPVDPGAHEIEGSAPGYQGDRHKVDLAEGKTATVELKLVPTPPAPQAVPPVAPVVAPPPPPPPRGPSGRRVGAFVAGGIGIAGGVVGAVTGGLMLAKKGTVSSDCASAVNGVSLCKNSEGVDAGNAAKTLGLVSSVGWVTAIAGLGVGTVLLVTEPRPQRPLQGRSGRWVSAGLLSASGSGAAFGISGDF